MPFGFKTLLCRTGTVSGCESTEVYWCHGLCSVSCAKLHNVWRKIGRHSFFWELSPALDIRERWE
ncbi:hypothetical protein BaRGS_00034901, partial [Batillaria attramentaria]